MGGSKFLCAQSSAIAAGYASYPFDTVRRRLQMQSEKPEAEWVYKGTSDCFAKIMKDLPLFSRVLVPMPYVLSELLWFLYFTLRSLLSSTPNKLVETGYNEHSYMITT